MQVWHTVEGIMLLIGFHWFENNQYIQATVLSSVARICGFPPSMATIWVLDRYIWTISGCQETSLSQVSIRPPVGLLFPCHRQLYTQATLWRNHKSPLSDLQGRLVPSLCGDHKAPLCPRPKRFHLLEIQLKLHLTNEDEKEMTQSKLRYAGKVFWEK